MRSASTRYSSSEGRAPNDASPRIISEREPRVSAMLMVLQHLPQLFGRRLHGRTNGGDREGKSAPAWAARPLSSCVEETDVEGRLRPDRRSVRASPRRSQSQLPWNDSKVISTRNPATVTAELVSSPRLITPAWMRLTLVASKSEGRMQSDHGAQRLAAAVLTRQGSSN